MPPPDGVTRLSMACLTAHGNATTVPLYANMATAATATRPR